MPTVSVMLFAGLREIVGQREIDVTLPEGATVDALRDRIGEDYPMTRAVLPTVVCAVGEEYVSGDEALREGDRVALIPPVSGGR
ncbi:MAG: molybdopterin converting factor subunit 1 [Dehalococcoidia bacterium]